MKPFSIILLTLLSLSVISCNTTKSTGNQTNSQPASEGKKSRPQNREVKDMTAIYDQLNLNSIQHDLLVQIDSKYESKIKSLRSSNNSGNRGAMKQQMDAVLAEKDAEIKKILDADQYIKLKELTPEPSRNRPQRH